MNGDGLMYKIVAMEVNGNGAKTGYILDGLNSDERTILTDQEFLIYVVNGMVVNANINIATGLISCNDCDINELPKVKKEKAKKEKNTSSNKSDENKEPKKPRVVKPKKDDKQENKDDTNGLVSVRHIDINITNSNDKLNTDMDMSVTVSVSTDTMIDTVINMIGQKLCYGDEVKRAIVAKGYVATFKVISLKELGNILNTAKALKIYGDVQDYSINVTSNMDINTNQLDGYKDKINNKVHAIYDRYKRVV